MALSQINQKKRYDMQFLMLSASRRLLILGNQCYCLDTTTKKVFQFYALKTSGHREKQITKSSQVKRNII